MSYDDEELQAIRQQKIARIQQEQALRESQKEQKDELEAQKRAILMQIMTEPARQRLNNIKLVKPQLAEAVEIRLIQLAQQGAIREKLTDDQLKDILRKLQGQSRETKIEIRRI